MSAYEGKPPLILPSTLPKAIFRIVKADKMGPMPKSGDDSLAPGPFDPEVDRR